MDKSTLQRSLRSGPPSDPIYRPRLGATAISQQDRRSSGTHGAQARYRRAIVVLGSVGVVILSIGAISLIGGSRGVLPPTSPSPSPVPTATTVPALSGAFAPGPVLPGPLVGHTATRLGDGRIMVIGGDAGELAPITASVEAWDAAGGSFESAGTLATARAGHTATLMTDGRILLIGGSSAGTESLAAELWDPATGTSDQLGSLEAQGGSTATLLPDGTVLVIDGVGADGRSGTDAHRWDLVTGVSSQVGSLGTPRDGYTATLLRDGRVLIVGGRGEPPLRSAEVWDPVSGSFSPTGSLTTGRSSHTATLLVDGRVLIVGGVGSTENLASAETWDPETGLFTPAGSLGTGRSSHTATLLDDGRVLVVSGLVSGAGADDRSAEIWDPVSGSFSGAGSLGTGRYGHTATRLDDGRVLIVGGVRGRTVLASTEIWDPRAAPSPEPRDPAPTPTPTPPPAGQPAGQGIAPGSLRDHMLTALAELRMLQVALSIAASQAGPADQEPLREPSKQVRQWAIDEEAWSADMAGAATSGCPEFEAWKQTAADLDLAATDEWRHIASNSPGDLVALRASIDAVLSLGAIVERHPCQTRSG